MAMNSTTLKNNLKPKIEEKIRAFILDGDTTPYPKLTQFSEAIAEAIAVEVLGHITGNAELDNAKFSGTFNGTINTVNNTCSVIATNHPVTGGIR